MAGKVSVMKRAGAEEKTFQTMYEDFEMNSKVKNLSGKTIEYYKTNLKPFQQFFDEKGINYIREIEKSHVDSFILWMRDRYSNAITINSYLRAVRAFLYYGMSLHYLQDFKINLIKAETKIKETYSEADITALISKPNLKGCSFGEYRDWVMVQYLLKTGNRLSTVINIRVEDINFGEGMVVLKHNKNRREQYSPITMPVMKTLTEYIKTWSLRGEDFLFPNSAKEQLTKSAMQHAVSRYNEKRGVERTSIHAFRHTFAKNYVKSGGNAFKLQKLLGHSSLNVTQNYVALYGDDLTEGFDKHSIIQKYAVGESIKRAKYL